MNRVMCCGVVALSLALSVTLFFLASPQPQVADDPRSLVDAVLSLFSDVESLQRQQEQFDLQLAQAQKRLVRKTEVARQLLSGRLSLAEAATIFAELHTENPWVVAALRERIPASHPDEVHAWGAIEMAVSLVPDPHRSSVESRLKAELEAWRASRSEKRFEGIGGRQ